MTIPANIFQTHKSLAYIASKPQIQNAVNSWKVHSSTFNYQFYTDEMCNIFIKENFSADVYAAYIRCPMAVMKADLWRYCVIYHFGGIYADTDTVCKVSPTLFLKEDAQLVFVPEPGHPFFCQWIFAAPKHSPILKSVIDLSVKRILEIPEIKGEHIIHYLTGPAVFTDGVEKYLRENNLPTFIVKNNYTKYPNPILFVFDNRTFHSNTIVHLYAGSHNDGWKAERYKKLTVRPITQVDTASVQKARTPPTLFTLFRRR
jgi:mannosyltransferase OCH1-like enzyme